MVNKARECVRFLITLVGSIGGEEALRLEEAFEHIIDGGETAPVTMMPRVEIKRRYNGRVHLNILQKVEAIELYDRGFRPKDIANKLGCSPNMMMGKRLVEMRQIVDRFNAEPRPDARTA